MPRGHRDPRRLALTDATLATRPWTCVEALTFIFPSTNGFFQRRNPCCRQPLFFSMFLRLLYRSTRISHRRNHQRGPSTSHLLATSTVGQQQQKNLGAFGRPRDHQVIQRHVQSNILQRNVQHRNREKDRRQGGPEGVVTWQRPRSRLVGCDLLSK
jgi:hypothetical protein